MQDVRQIVIAVTNFAGGGLKDVSTVQCALWDVTTGDTRAGTPMGRFVVNSAPGADADKSTVILCKLYRVSGTRSIANCIRSLIVCSLSYSVAAMLVLFCKRQLYVEPCIGLLGST